MQSYRGIVLLRWRRFQHQPINFVRRRSDHDPGFGWRVRSEIAGLRRERYGHAGRRVVSDGKVDVTGRRAEERCVDARFGLGIPAKGRGGLLEFCHFGVDFLIAVVGGVGWMDDTQRREEEENTQEGT